MNIKVSGKTLRVGTHGEFDTASSPPVKKIPQRKRKPKK